MTVRVGDCVEVMAGMEPESVDAVVTDPPYGIGFMGREWDSLARGPVEKSWATKGRNLTVKASAYGGVTGTGFREPNPRCGNCGRATKGRDTAKGFKVCHCDKPLIVGTPNREAQRSQVWHQEWATAALRVARPGAYLLAFGGTRTSHRLACAIEDAGWIIRDTLVWAYAQGFPKSRSSLKPAWEPIVMARKPGPLRELAIDECRIGTEPTTTIRSGGSGAQGIYGTDDRVFKRSNSARWPANVILTDPIFDGGWDGVVGGGESRTGVTVRRNKGHAGGHIDYAPANPDMREDVPAYEPGGGISRFFLLPKAPRRERIVDGERSPHPTQKPEALIRHLVKLVNVRDGVVLDPFLGSGTLGVVCDGLGIEWIGIEREPEYAAWAERRVAANRPEWMEASA